MSRQNLTSTPEAPSLPSHHHLPSSPQKPSFEIHHQRWFWLFSTFPKRNDAVFTIQSTVHFWCLPTQLYVYYSLLKVLFSSKNHSMLGFSVCSCICRLCESYSHGGLIPCDLVCGHVLLAFYLWECFQAGPYLEQISICFCQASWLVTKHGTTLNEIVGLGLFVPMCRYC